MFLGLSPVRSFAEIKHNKLPKPVDPDPARLDTLHQVKLHSRNHRLQTSLSSNYGYKVIGDCQTCLGINTVTDKIHYRTLSADGSQSLILYGFPYIFVILNSLCLFILFLIYFLMITRKIARILLHFAIKMS